MKRKTHDRLDMARMIFEVALYASWWLMIGAGFIAKDPWWFAVGAFLILHDAIEGKR